MNRGRVGWFHLKKAKVGLTPREKFNTGPSMYKRQHFGAIKPHWNRMYMRIGASGCANTPETPPYKKYAYLPGDVRRKPEFDFYLAQPSDRRTDKAEYAWKKRGKLQLFQMGPPSEIFVCFDCGYPVKSHLVAVKSDNWDWRMCYHCYLRHTKENTADR